MKRAFAVLTLTSLVAAPLLAAGLQSDLDALVNTERAFAQMGAEKGIKDSFLTYIADDGVLFRPGPVNGKQFLNSRPNPKAQLHWAPSYADISRSGDLGWDIGPWEALRPDGTPAGHGHFATIWKKQADGNWRFMVDFGIGHDTAVPLTGITVPPLKAAKKSGAAPKPDPNAKDSLLAADRAFGQATAQGTSAAYLAHLADDARFLRNDAVPSVGTEAIRAALAKEPAKMTEELLAGDVSKAGDMGYTYGNVEWQDKDGAAQKGNYMRAWEKRNGAWKIVLDVLNPAPPPPPAPPAPAAPAAPPAPAPTATPPSQG
jgi:ketosteroid isomerase-like protein